MKISTKPPQYLCAPKCTTMHEYLVCCTFGIYASSCLNSKLQFPAFGLTGNVIHIQYWMPVYFGDKKKVCDMVFEQSSLLS